MTLYRNGTVFIPTKERAIKNFWTKVRKTEGCWIWTGAKSTDGYGCFGTGEFGSRRAHRFCWELSKEQIPEGQELCHSCDNPSCVNPNHLFVGSHSDNMKDAAKKRRFPLKYGTDHPRGKWTDLEICSMLHMYESGIKPKQIREKFGISRGYFWMLVCTNRRQHAFQCSNAGP